MNEILFNIQKVALQNQEKTFSEKLRIFAELFDSAKYGAWRDGSNLYALDDFNFDLQHLDCVTYVEVVLAIAICDPHVEPEQFCTDFAQILQDIHYAHGVPNFLMRNHFTCLDWIANNQHLVADITPSIYDQVYSASATIDKLAWVKKHAVFNKHPIAIRAEELVTLQPQTSTIPYIKTSDFLQHYESIKQRFPECCIVNIVRPNWDLTEQIGTHLNISHLGFVFKDETQNTLMFYHSSSNLHKVGKESLLSYMTRYKDSPTIDGFDVVKIIPGYRNSKYY